MTEPRLLFFAGSARSGSHNRKLAKLAHAIASANGLHGTLVELQDYPMPLYNGDDEAAGGAPPAVRQLHDLMMQHSGVWIAAPEYNASITPLLKNTLDWLSRIRVEGEAALHVFRSRVFALGSASPGGMGGLRGLTTVRHVLETGLGALVLPDQVAVSRANDAFDSHGHLINKDTQDALKKQLEKLARTAKALYS